jgi:two-component system, NtrC family, sensor kinase
MKQRRDKAIRSLWMVLAASVAIPALLLGYAAASSYRAAFELADERIDRALAISAEQAGRIFGSIGVTLDSVEQILRGKAETTIKDSEAELSERLKQFTRAFPDVASIWILDGDGDALVSSLFYPLPPAVNGSDRAYLKEELARDGSLHVGRVVRIAMTDRILFPVSKRRADSSGTFIGTTTISVLPKAFEDFYRTLGGNTTASYALLRNDGNVLARYPTPTRPGIVLDSDSGYRQLLARSPEGGRYTTVSAVDGLERRFAVRRLPGLPIYVSSSLETREIRNDWLGRVSEYLLIGVPAIVMLVVLIVLTIRRTSEFYAEAARREAAEESLRRTQRMDSIGQLTGGIAHDFNNLLTVILGNLQMALRQAPEGRLQAQLANARRGAERAADLTKRLLAFSRIQALDPKTVDLNRLVSNLSDLLGRTLGETISIETVRAAGLWQVEADPTELESAILNLAVNARDAMPEGGKLTLETANAFLDEHYCRTIEGLKPGQYAMLSVADDGTGMSKEVIGKVFDPFFTTKPPGAGTGLGLSQVYGFVRQSGGHVAVYSEIGHGTTVKVYLPRSSAGPASDVADGGSEPLVRGNGEHLLVVEDDDEVRSFVATTLRDLGYRVTDVRDAAAALACLDAGAPDLLLTDVVMPGMNGRLLADEALRRVPHLKVLYMTGYSRNAIVHHGRLDPGVSVIQKPFSQGALAQRVRRILAEG